MESEGRRLRGLAAQARERGEPLEALKLSDEAALAIPLERLATVQEELGLLDDAVKSYREAVEKIESNPPAEHKVPERPAIVADFKIHLTTCEYNAGDKSALERAESALLELESHPDIADYNQHVWVSGGHMRIAEMLQSDDPEKAKEHLQKAKEIIDSDPRLTIRLAQWQKLAEKFE